MRVLLLFDDTTAEVGVVRDALQARGHRLTDPAERHGIDLAIADSDVARSVDLVAALATASPGVELILIGPSSGTEFPDVFARLERPCTPPALLAAVDAVAEIVDSQRLREPAELVAYDTVFAGASAPLLELVRRVRLVARTDVPAWIVGDDGSGRNVIARALHDRSARRGEPFVAINAAAHDDDALCVRLFEGPGAAVAEARAGTLFIDHAAHAGPATQRALLRFLDEPAPAGRPRIIVGVQRSDHASPRALSAELYFRLKVIEIDIPPLAQRASDLGAISERMLARLGAGRERPALSADALRVLEAHAFQGNLLELAHAVTHAYVMAHGRTIEPQHLPTTLLHAQRTEAGERELESLDTVARRFEREYLLRVLRSVGGNRGRAAEILGLSRKGLWGKLKAHGVTDEEID